MTFSWLDRTTTAESLAHVGKGKVAVTVEIPGVGCYQTYSYTPTDSWFSTGWNNETDYLFDLLEWDIGRFNERASYLEADLKVSPITIHIADVAGGMTSQLKDWKARANTKLITTVTSTATTFSTLNTSDFAAGAALMWIGQECVKRTGITGVSFTGLTRAYLGTLQQPYEVIATDIPPTRPMVTDGPHGLYQRSVYIHAAVIDPSTKLPGASQVIFRGRVKKSSKIGKGKLSLSVEHKIAVFGDKVGQDMPSTAIPPYQYWCTGVGVDDGGYGSDIFAITGAGIPGSRGPMHITPDEGLYTVHGIGPDSRIADLPNSWTGKAALLPTSPVVTPWVTWDGERCLLRCEAAGADLTTSVTSYFGSPLWMLGFDAASYGSGINARMEVSAQSKPRLLVIDCQSADTTLPYFQVDNPDVLTANLRAQIPGNYACKITNTDSQPAIADSRIVTIDPLNGDFWGEVAFREKLLFYAVNEPDAMRLRHAIVLGSAEDTVPQTFTENALKRLLGVDRSGSGVTEPRSWFPQDVRYSDVDWDELTTAFDSAPADFQVWHDVILAGVEVWKAIGPVFGLLGICPRLTDDGKIGFKRMDDMLATEAEPVSVDGDVWDGINAAQVMGRLAHGPMVNQVVVRHSYDYRFEDGEPTALGGLRGAAGSPISFAGSSEWGAPIKIRNAGGMANMAGVKSVEYKLRGWRPEIAPSVPLETYAQIIKLQVNATHFSLYGMDSGVTSIPATWLAKQFRVGDTVLLTHEVVPDTADGAIGIALKPVKIEGAIRQITSDRPDELTIRYGPTTYVAGIAPCAHGDGWTVGTLTMDFSDADTPLYEQAGKNDLTRFDRTSGTVDVLLIQRDDITPLSYTGTIVAGGVDTSAKTAKFDADPFAGAGLPAGGVYMTLPDWDDAAAWQQAYAYSADTGVPPTLGTTDDHTKEWSL